MEESRRIAAAHAETILGGSPADVIFVSSAGAPVSQFGYDGASAEGPPGSGANHEPGQVASTGPAAAGAWGPSGRIAGAMVPITPSPDLAALIAAHARAVESSGRFTADPRVAPPIGQGPSEAAAENPLYSPGATSPLAGLSSSYTAPLPGQPAGSFADTGAALAAEPWFVADRAGGRERDPVAIAPEHGDPGNRAGGLFATEPATRIISARLGDVIGQRDWHAQRNDSRASADRGDDRHGDDRPAGTAPTTEPVRETIAAAADELERLSAAVRRTIDDLERIRGPVQPNLPALPANRGPFRID
jgi:hypothetical protein